MTAKAKQNTDAEQQIRGLAKSLLEARDEMQLARRQSTAWKPLLVRAERMAVQASRAVVELVHLGVKSFEPLAHPLALCDEDGGVKRYSDRMAMHLWQTWISSFLRKFDKASRAKAGAFDFPTPKRDTQGNLLGSNGKPITTRQFKECGWKLSDRPATAFDSLDEDGKLEFVRCQVDDWAKACDLAWAEVDKLLSVANTTSRQGDSLARDEKLPEAACDSPKPTKAKRSTQRGEGREKIIAALTKHHKYADGGCLNLEPIGNNEAARLAGVSESTASGFFNKQFDGHTKYRAICADATRLVAALKLLNQEFSPHHLFGAKPPGEDEREDDE